MKLARRRSDDPLRPLKESFTSTAVLVEQAQRALLASVPTARDPGIPPSQALKDFTDLLSEAVATMSAWRDDRVLHEWTSCSEALLAARSTAESLLPGTEPLNFEELNARIGDALYPLETFADVERSLRRRR